LMAWKGAMRDCAILNRSAEADTCMLWRMAHHDLLWAHKLA
jgi:hypothetical protein